MARPYIITALDIGSGSIKAVCAAKKPGEDGFEILTKVEEPALGVRRGVVVNSAKVTEIISSIIKKIEESSGKKISGVYANIGGGHIFSASSRGLVSVSRADQKISEEDIMRVLKAAQTFSIPQNKEILEVFPKEFFVDGESGVKDAIGMKGVRLEADVLAVCGFSPYLKNSKRTILDAGLEINYLAANPLLSSRAVLTQREKELGVCVLDIGAGTTDMSVYEEGNLIHAAIFPIGSGHITSDIAVCLKTDIDTAEKIKIEFGTCKQYSPIKAKSKAKDSSMIRIGGEEPLSFSKKMLSDIISARVSEIFDLVSKELKKISRYESLPAGIVLTGGGARIPYIKETARKELKLPCRIGTPVASAFHDDPSMANLCGLIMEGADLEEENNSQTGFLGIFGSRLRKIFGMFVP